MLLIITGNGKGKTTSALGMAFRGLGWGKKVALVFFDKGGPHYGEQHFLDSAQEKIDVFRFGKPRFDSAKQTFRFGNTSEDVLEVKKGIAKVRELLTENYFLIVCDELIGAMNCGLAGESAVRDLIDRRPQDTHLLMTGRAAPDWLIEKADLVSEIHEVKHPYQKTKKAIEGIDF